MKRFKCKKENVSEWKDHVGDLLHSGNAKQVYRSLDDSRSRKGRWEYFSIVTWWWVRSEMIRVRGC